jgi:hypothetical protein
MNRYLFPALLAVLVAIAGCNLSDPGQPPTSNNGDEDAITDTRADVPIKDTNVDSQTSDDAESDADAGDEADTSNDVETCEDGGVVCGATCIDTRTNPDHCGGCNQRCRPPANALVDGCQAGDCIYRCDDGYYDLDDDLGDPSGNGCEADCQPTNGGVETCDQVDNDCDGSVDEGACACDPGDSRDCGQSEGACQTGTQECGSDGTWGACEGATGPETETCDDVDNDCDGSVDENLERVCGQNQGACSEGTETCSAGVWGSCDAVQPSTETCDGQDNDCDGTVDEDFPDKGASCTEGVGPCQDSGAYVCNSNGTGVVCDATPGSPSTETCDDIDNDCDGSVDENLTRSCGTNTGVCSEGTETCSGGQWGSCQGQTTGSSEICDGQDNDCDGQTDEGFPDKGSSCTVGTGACQRSGTYVCTANGNNTTCDATAGSGTPEQCDGIDNDCDGNVDESLTRTCGTNTGVCSTGTETCSGGQWGSCQGGNSGGTEVCDGADNDCDGQTDEFLTTTYYFDDDGDGYGTSSSITACSSSGNYTATQSGDCDDGNSSVYPGAPVNVCNSTDFDCDGVTGCADNDCSTGDACVSGNQLGSCSGSSCSTGTGGCMQPCAIDEYCTCGGEVCCPNGQLCLCP